MEQQTFNFNENENKGPVTVLGKTFANDDERREYFREELRKKLPELKKIEGYPIGEDDDIIELSDPPYYTACPNPWLNDFIAEWEEEKKVLEKEGKRKKNLEVKEPYASDVSEGKNNPIYNAHSYHTKVPHPAIMRYILHYTQPGDIVFDGFCGTGMTGVAARMCGNPNYIYNKTNDLKYELKLQIETERKKIGYTNTNWGTRYAICSDLSPVASFISYNYNSSINEVSFKSEALKLLTEVEKEYGWMYETKHKNGDVGIISNVIWSDVFVCPDCGNEIVFYDAAVDENEQKVADVFPCNACGAMHKKEDLSKAYQSYLDSNTGHIIQQAKLVPVLIQYKVGNKRYMKKPDRFDFDLIKRIDAESIPYWYPTDALPSGYNTKQPIQSHKYTNIHHFFTKRNLWIASAIYEKFKKKPVFHILMNSYLSSRGSKMARYRIGRAGNSSLPGTLYISSTTAETNLFNGYRGKVDDFAKVFSRWNGGNVVAVCSASNISIKDNSIDYIFTDPPFGANIMYSELNFIQEGWLKIKTDNKEEAIENNIQQKGLLEYQAIMQKCFAEYYRILKPGKWITVEFSNTSAAVWNSIQLSLNRVGFVIASVSSLDKQQGSFKAVTSPTAVKQDLVISCYKPSDSFYKKFTAQSNVDGIWFFIEEHLCHLLPPSLSDKKSVSVIERSPKVLYDRLITYYLMHGLPVPIDAADFQEGLKARYTIEDGMVFNNQQLAEYQKLKKEHAMPHQLKLIVDIIENESDAIQWLREKLDEKPMKYQDIQPDYRKAYAINRKGEIEVELKNILEENFIENNDHTWRTPNLEEQKDREALRKKSLLRVWNEYVESIEKNDKKIKDVRLEALRVGFKDCIDKKDYKKLVMVANKIPENILTEDEMLLNYYDIAEGKL